MYIGKTGRPLEVHIKEHKYYLAQGPLEKSQLAQHAYEEGHRACLKEAKVLQIEPNNTYRKYKKSIHMTLVDHTISQPSLDTLSYLDYHYCSRSQKAIILSSVNHV
jgi:hypothetical protein